MKVIEFKNTTDNHHLANNILGIKWIIQLMLFVINN